MVPFHLHTLDWDDPFLAIQVYLAPFRAAHFGGADERIRQKKQAQTDNLVLLVAINGSEEGSRRSCVRDSGSMFFRWERQKRPPDLSGRVPVRQPRGDGVTKNLRQKRSDTRALVGGLLLYGANMEKDVTWRDAFYIPTSKNGKNVFVHSVLSDEDR